MRSDANAPVHGSRQLIICRGCGLQLPDCGDSPDADSDASGECRRLFGELQAYTLGRGDPAFIHQHVVDAYAAQHTSGTSPNLRTAFALVGLYLALEKGSTGRNVQRMHMKLARIKREWPQFTPPVESADVTVRDVMQAAPGAKRDEMIIKWATAVWASWRHAHDWARQTCDDLLQ